MLAISFYSSSHRVGLTRTLMYVGDKEEKRANAERVCSRMAGSQRLEGRMWGRLGQSEEDMLSRGRGESRGEPM